LTVAEINSNTHCFETIKLLQEDWVVIEIDKQQDESDEENIELVLDEVDDWLENQTKPPDYHATKYIQFYRLEEKLLSENEAIRIETTELITRVAAIVRENHPHLSFTPTLSGSTSEGTKVGPMDELYFLCFLENLSDDLQKCEIIKSSQLPGFVQIAVGEDDFALSSLSVSQELNGKRFISSEFIGQQFNNAICEAFSCMGIWDGLHLSWGTEVVGTCICTIKLYWVGKSFKGKEISVDIVPALNIFPMKSTVSLDLKLNRLMKYLDLEETSQKTILVAKLVRSMEIKNSHLFWRRSYSLLETKIFQLIPESIREGYKLAKFVRDTKICPRVGYSKDVQVSDDGYGYVSSYLLKTCLFNEILVMMDAAGRKDVLLQQDNALFWATRILDRLELSVQNEELHNFFDDTINLKKDGLEPFVKAVCRIGKAWLNNQWDDINYCQ